MTFIAPPVVTFLQDPVADGDGCTAMQYSFLLMLFLPTAPTLQGRLQCASPGQPSIILGFSLN